MTKHLPTQVRGILKTAPDGMSATQLAEMLDKPRDSVFYSLRERMADAYIDRWRPVPNRHGGKPCQYEAIWCLADVPQDCPKPEGAA